MCIYSCGHMFKDSSGQFSYVFPYLWVHLRIQCPKKQPTLYTNISHRFLIDSIGHFHTFSKFSEFSAFFFTNRSVLKHLSATVYHKTFMHLRLISNKKNGINAILNSNPIHWIGYVFKFLFLISLYIKNSFKESDFHES